MKFFWSVWGLHNSFQRNIYAWVGCLQNGSLGEYHMPTSQSVFDCPGYVLHAIQVNDTFSSAESLWQILYFDPETKQQSPVWKTKATIHLKSMFAQ